MARDYQKENQTPEARARRRRYNESPKGQAANRKGQGNYKRKYPHRVAAQQKVRHSHGSASGHRCRVCGKPATAKHHTNYGGDGGSVEWLCHAHHVARHHDTNMTKKSARFVVLEKGGKVSKDEATYMTAPSEEYQRCKSCKYFSAPSDCHLVEGNISPSATCYLWTSKTGQKPTIRGKVYSIDAGKVVAKSHKDKLPGGLADLKKPTDFPADALAQGVTVELEHTKDRKLAQEIAMDHLTEDEKYYRKLKTVEKSVQDELRKAADDLEAELSKGPGISMMASESESKKCLDGDEVLQKPKGVKKGGPGSVRHHESGPSAATSTVRTSVASQKPAIETLKPLPDPKPQPSHRGVVTRHKPPTMKYAAKSQEPEETEKAERKPGQAHTATPAATPAAPARPVASTSAPGVQRHTPKFTATRNVPKVDVASRIGVGQTGTRLKPATRPTPTVPVGTTTTAATPGSGRTLGPGQQAKIRTVEGPLRPGERRHENVGTVQAEAPGASRTTGTDVPRPPKMRPTSGDVPKLSAIGQIFSAVGEASKPGGGRGQSNTITPSGGRALDRFISRVATQRGAQGARPGDPLLPAPRPRIAQKAVVSTAPSLSNGSASPTPPTPMGNGTPMGKGESIPMVGGVGVGMMKTKDGKEANVSEKTQKSYNSLQEGELTSGDLGNSKNDPLNSGGGSSGQEFSSDSRIGMPSADPGQSQTWSDDDKDVSGQMSDHKKPLEANAGQKGTSERPDLERGANQVMEHYGMKKAMPDVHSDDAIRTQNASHEAYRRLRYDQNGGPDLVKGLGVASQPTEEEVEKSQAHTWHQGRVLYTDGEDQFIEKAQNARGEITPEPTLGIPHSPLTSTKGCGLCKSAMPAYLTTCPSCGVAEGVGPHVGSGHVVLEKAVADSIRPQAQHDLYLPFGTQNVDSE